MTQLVPSSEAPRHTLVDTHHRPWRIPHERLLHLQFRRFAGCPICSVHLGAIAQRIGEIEAAGVQEIVVFNASREALEAHHGSLPFPVVPDLERVLFGSFGVRSSAAAMSSPTAWAAAAAGMRLGRSIPSPERASAAMLLPAEFLIAPNGTVLASHYASHAADQWPVEVLLSKIREVG